MVVLEVQFKITPPQMLPNLLKILRQAISFRRISLIIALGICLPFVLLTPYNFPGSDDYDDYRFIQLFGHIGTFLEYYLEWGGRYTSVLLTLFLNTVGAESLIPYRLLSILTLGMLALFCYSLAGVFQKTLGSSDSRIPAFLVFLILIWGYLPSPVELLYWFTGSWVYLPGMVLAVLWMNLLLVQRPMKKYERVGLYVFPFLIAGTNETMVVGQFGLLALCYFLYREKRRMLMGIFLVFLAGCLLSLLAPGNSVRQQFFLVKAGNPAADPLFSLRHSILTFWHWSRDWLRSTPLLIAGIILWLYADENRSLSLSGIRKNLIAITIATLTLVALTLPFFWGTGRPNPAQRVLNVYWIAFVILSTWVTVFILQMMKAQRPSPKILSGFLYFILIGGLSYRSNWRTAVNDLKIAPEYAKQADQRIQDAISAEENDTLIYQPLLYKPVTLVYIDLSEDPGHWYNRGFAYRYGLAAVKINPEKSPKE